MKRVLAMMALAITILGLTVQVALGTVKASAEDSTLPMPVNLAASAMEGTVTTTWGWPDEATSIRVTLSTKANNSEGYGIWYHPWIIANPVESVWTTAVPSGAVYDAWATAYYPNGDWSSRATTTVVAIAPVVRGQNYLKSRLKRGTTLTVRVYAWPRVVPNKALLFDAFPVRNRAGRQANGYPNPGRVQMYIDHYYKGRGWRTIKATTVPWVVRNPKSYASYKWRTTRRTRTGWYRFRYIVYLDYGFSYRGSHPGKISYTSRSVKVVR